MASGQSANLWSKPCEQHEDVLLQSIVPKTQVFPQQIKRQEPSQSACLRGQDLTFILPPGIHADLRGTVYFCHVSQAFLSPSFCFCDFVYKFVLNDVTLVFSFSALNSVFLKLFWDPRGIQSKHPVLPMQFQ